MGDSLAEIWADLDLTRLGSSDHFLVNSFHPYSLATLMQYWEYLTDRQMAQATRTRMDMKYALHLPLNFPGIEPNTLCEFRQHILASEPATGVLEEMILSLSRFGKRVTPRQGADVIIASICLPSRAETILECMDMALEAVAALDPNWLRTHTLPHWYRRYHLKLGHWKLPYGPEDVESFMESVGNDGWHLLKTIKASDAQILSQLPEIKKLYREWQRQFKIEENTLKFRKSHCQTCISEQQVIKNTIKRKETGQLKHPHLNPPAGGKGQASEK